MMLLDISKEIALDVQRWVTSPSVLKIRRVFFRYFVKYPKGEAAMNE